MEFGRIEVTLTKNESTITIKITDNGKGIPSDLLKKVGTDYFSYGKQEGSGLGITYAKEILETWSGSLTIESDAGNGTQVTLHFPQPVTKKLPRPQLPI